MCRLISYLVMIHTWMSIITIIFVTSLLQYDPEGFGEIPWDDFVEVLKTPEFVAEVAPNKRDILAERAQERKTPAITFQDFVNIVCIYTVYITFYVSIFTDNRIRKKDCSEYEIR